MEQFMEDFNRHGKNAERRIGRDDFIEALKMLQTDDVIALFGINKFNPQFKLQHSMEM